MNSFNCIGRLGIDPQCRYFESGSCVAQFNIALDKGKDKQGNKREPVWVPVKAWNGTAKLIVDYFKKGDLIGLSGELEQENWEDKQTGAKRSKLILNARQMSFVGGKQKDTAQGYEPTQHYAPANPGPPPAPRADAAFGGGVAQPDSGGFEEW